MNEEDRIKPLELSLEAGMNHTGSPIAFESLTAEQIESLFGFGLKSRNPLFRFTVNGSGAGAQQSFLAFTLVLNGLQRSNTRAEAFARAIADTGGRIFDQNPFLLVYDYVGQRMMLVSAAKLFSAFAERAATETLVASRTASFTLSPHFENGTISMYGTLRDPDVKIIDTVNGPFKLAEFEAWLSQVRKETEAIAPRISTIVHAVRSRILARELRNDDPASEYILDAATEYAPVEATLVKEETDNSGTGTGVEAEAPQAPDEEKIAEPFDPENIDVITRSMTVDLLLSRADSQMIDLQPDFQRRWGIWDNRRQSRLIESLLLRIPLPVLYAAEDDDERWEIVDGIQRLSTISKFIRPSIVESEPLVLTDLEYLTNYNGKLFSDLAPRLQMRLRETELVIHLIRKGTPPAVKFNIFARINTGGIALSSQELRHAITPGPARKLLQDWANSSHFKSATDGSVRSIRMDDRELVLRFVAFYSLGLDAYKQPDMDGFLVSAMKAINNFSETRLLDVHAAFSRSMKTAHEIFGRNAFRKRFVIEGARLPINKALFEAVSVNLARLSEPERLKLVQRKEAVDAAIISLCNDRSFESAISQGTGDVRKVQRRFNAVGDAFKQVLNHA